jgi:hypothetical protein
MRFYIPGKKEMESAKVVASVGYGKDVAFYAVAEDYEEVIQSVKEKASTYFPGLMETKNTWTKISKAYLNEVSIPDSLFNRALKRLPGRTVAGKEIPPEIAVPLELELAPIVGFGKEGGEIGDLDILKRRGLLCKTEVCMLEKCNPFEAVFVEVDGKPFWKLVLKGVGEKLKYIHAQISNPQLQVAIS